MPRYVLIDGFRGFFLVFMLINHLNGTIPLPFAAVNHAKLGFVEDAQGFVLLSGVVSGLFYGGLALKKGDALMRTRIRDRVLTILRYHAWVLLAVAVLILATGSAAWETMAPLFYRDFDVAVASAGTLLYQPTFMDILPMYMIYLALTPAMIALMRSGRTLELLAGSVLLWMLAQTGLPGALASLAEGAVRLAVPAFEIRWGFDPLGWQVLFVFGVWVGFGMTSGRIDPAAWVRTHCRGLFLLLAGGAVFFLAAKLVFKLELLGPDFSETFGGSFVRFHFSVLHVVNFLVYLGLVLWLLILGPESHWAPVRALARLMDRFFRLPWLVFLGQHSLQVYAWHVLVVYLAAWLVTWTGDPGPVAASGIGLLALASLTLPAWLHARSRGPKRPAPAATTAPKVAPAGQAAAPLPAGMVPDGRLADGG
ncbi:OpgC family protein [Rhodospirillum centenum]|uniref:Membrane protein, putative n=1 Tax=Rhodospirillum centenum (strain ATCC 51521 / SW) TaxID=414684 RepID=B6IU77_RHOCS|nr:OpgC domain-containing protein [Rhodospirillum centenum]ACI99954.1 membrane protein, putative [Rhodospirillum centenum SW]